MDLFSNPISVLLALLCVVLCFGVPFGAVLYILKDSGLWNRAKEEINSGFKEEI